MTMSMFKDKSLWEHFAAGGVAGAVSRTATAPLDRIKVFLQVRGKEFVSLKYCTKELIKEGGMLSFWRGNGINVLKIAPETAIKFMAYEQAKRYIRDLNDDVELNFFQRFAAGAYAGIISQSVIYPMEVLKTKLVLGQTGDHQGIMHCAAKIKRAGMQNFYRGFSLNVIGIIPYAGIDLAVYETLKRAYLKSHENDPDRTLPRNEAQAYILMICGAVSSSVGQLCSYPIALIRTRLQASVLSDNKISAPELIKNIYDKEGLVGFYRGIVPNFMKVAPAVSISYVVYELTRRKLGVEMC